MGEYENLKRGERGAWVSIIAYLILAVTKLFVASIGNSEALRADGLNNTTDIVASVAVLIGLKISRKPPDEDHHYGHFKAETIASLIAAFIMVTIGLEVIFGTFQDIINQEVSEPSLLTAWTALTGAAIMFGVYKYNINLSSKVNSNALYAAAQDNKSDALVSVGAAIGIFGAQLGIYWLDPLAGLIVGIIICKTAWDIFYDASHRLTDGFDEQEIESIRKLIEAHPDVWAVKDVKGRLQGNQTLVDATIHINPSLTIEQGHVITDEVEKILEEELHIYHAHIHIEPYDNKNE
ncbi:cation diffusion facilitator family transporter [Halobacillus sp. A1]|uniref:cation diffusion facilitator family transporter n=1 Tax=Halobacillus sp. A1 TaxID=2880262 RepID=UPI0020A673C2|nr:cation diffusion facilitator family transporter [Halobacillus sp. A1]MCP3032460.1 cation diffusion facilitator family transporter [Halobacillus sp. A1]